MSHDATSYSRKKSALLPRGRLTNNTYPNLYIAGNIQVDALSIQQAITSLLLS